MHDEWVAFLVGILTGSILAASIAYAGTRSCIHNSAIEAGVAEWQVNPKTGETKFQWKAVKE